jgi:KDO2-lipid IV(A) lauroyltransferase
LTIDDLRFASRYHQTVQAKMASRNRAVRALASVTSHVWFPTALFFARNVPRRRTLAIAAPVARAYFRLRPKYLSAVRANLAIILGLPEDSPTVRARAEDMVRGHFAAWCDFLHFATRPPHEAARLIESVVGFSHIAEARARGRGVLLLTGHLGNWEVGGLMLAEIGQPIHVVLVPDIFPGVERARQRLHRERGVVEIPVDRSFVPTLTVMRALESNAIVAMHGDRDFNNTGIAVPFFGREAFFPRGPFRVAMATGATVLPAFIVRVPDGRYRAIIEEPLEIERTGGSEETLRRNVERYVRILERYVGAYPEQWYSFYPIWDDPSRRRAGETAAPPARKRAAGLSASSRREARACLS